MLNKRNFFNNFNFNLTKLNRNLKETRKIFHKFKMDLDNNEIPLLSSYEKDYELNFSIKMDYFSFKMAQN